jgi:transcriptional regulator with XRE-family HTH domain
LNSAASASTIRGVSFRVLLQTEFDRRRSANRRYSLRAFARFLAIDHSALSQILRGKRRLTARSVRALGSRLSLDAPAVAEHCAAENEAAILDAIGRPNFRADSRWLSTMSGVPLDQVNVALQRLLRKGLLVMQARERWIRPKEKRHG